MEQEYDLVIIGRGAAAFSAAIRTSEITSNQAAIAMIGFGPIGGTCVNVGIKFQNILILAPSLLFNGFPERFHEFVEGN